MFYVQRMKRKKYFQNYYLFREIFSFSSIFITMTTTKIYVNSSFSMTHLTSLLHMFSHPYLMLASPSHFMSSVGVSLHFLWRKTHLLSCLYFQLFRRFIQPFQSHSFCRCYQHKNILLEQLVTMEMDVSTIHVW